MDRGLDVGSARPFHSMAVHVLDAMAREGFEEVVAIHDHRTGLRAFLAIHDTLAGPALGGIRRFSYRDEKEALLDCLRLALHMSFKCVLAGIPGGGAKTVILDRADLDLPGAYRHLGEAIERLGGRYLAGPDVGSGQRELDWVSERTRFAAGPDAGAKTDLEGVGEGPGDLAAATAAGVFAGMRAGLEALDGTVDWERRRVVIQGLGSVGRTLAARLVEEGAHVMASEINPEVAERAARELGVELIESGRDVATPCDIFSPCAMGGILHDVSIPKLAARMVCGAANNQLARARHAQRMHARRVLYLPDIVVNSGAVMRGAAYHVDGLGTPLEEIEERIGTLARVVLEQAQRADESPARTAERRARLALEARRKEPNRSLFRAQGVRASTGRGSAGTHRDDPGTPADSTGRTVPARASKAPTDGESTENSPQHGDPDRRTLESS